jgi:hypothetical protein
MKYRKSEGYGWVSGKFSPEFGKIIWFGFRTQVGHKMRNVYNIYQGCLWRYVTLWSHIEIKEVLSLFKSSD